VQEKVDLDSLAIKQTFSGDPGLTRGPGELEPQTKPGTTQPQGKNLEPLSAIIAELNERFGTNLTDKDKVTLGQLQDLLGADESLKASVRVNPPETARLAFDQVVQERLQEIVESNFDLYKRLADDPAFARVLIDWLFSEFRRESALQE